MAGRTAGPLYRSLADRLRFARRVAGMTQRDVAAAIGSRPAQVRRYETGAAPISAATMLRLAVALDAPLSWLYGVDDSDHWPDTLIAALFRDPQMPGLVGAFSRIADAEARRMVVTVAEGLANRPRRAPPPGPPQLGPCDGRRRRALLVDDTPDVLIVVGAFLRAGGFEVVRVHGAEAALKVIDAGEPLDVLVTDYAMPEMDGIELVRRATALRPGLAAVVITAFAADLALAAGRMPNLLVLAKPFARIDLLSSVRTVCARAEAG